MLFAAQADAMCSLAFALVPDLLAYVAGGFAADYTYAADLDLWMLGDPTLEHTAQVLRDLGVKPGRSQDEVTVMEPITSCLMIVPTPFLPIHILGTDKLTIQSLLDTFDISTHRWALSRTGTLIAGEGATKPWETGRVLTYRYPASTDKRVARLQTRYDIEILPYVDPKKGRAA